MPFDTFAPAPNPAGSGAVLTLQFDPEGSGPSIVGAWDDPGNPDRCYFRGIPDLHNDGYLYADEPNRPRQIIRVRIAPPQLTTTFTVHL